MTTALILLVGSALTVLLCIRLLLALFLPKTRALVRERPWLHVGWGLVSIVFLVYVWGNASPMTPKRHPGRYGPISGDLYWRFMSLPSHSKEIARKDGIIFCCHFGHHGPMYFAIRESDAAAARQDALRGMVDRDAGERDRPADTTRLTRLAMLTKREFPDINSFREWWNEARSDFVFDEEAHERFRNYNFGEGYPNERTRRIENRHGAMMKLEREVIMKGDYRAHLKPWPTRAEKKPDASQNNQPVSSPQS